MKLATISLCLVLLAVAIQAQDAQAPADRMGSGDRAAGDVIENGSEDSAGGESGGMGMGMGSKSGSNDLLDNSADSPSFSSVKGGNGKGGEKGNGGYSTLLTADASVIQGKSGAVLAASMGTVLIAGMGLMAVRRYRSSAGYAEVDEIEGVMVMPTEDKPLLA